MEKPKQVKHKQRQPKSRHKYLDRSIHVTVEAFDDEDVTLKATSSRPGVCQVCGSQVSKKVIELAKLVALDKAPCTVEDCSGFWTVE